MKQSFTWITALAFAAIFLLTACMQQAAPGRTVPGPGAAASPETQAPVAAAFPITITDSLGRKVIIERPPQRIVSLAPSNTETLFALGLDDRVAGVTNYCDYPEGAKLKPRVAGYLTPDIEKLVTIAPDLVLAEFIHEQTVLPTLEKAGLTVIVLSARSLDEIIGNISLVGQVTGRDEAAAQLTRQLSARVKAITSKTGLLPPGERPRVMYVIWHDPIWTMGGKSYIDDMLTKAGGDNIFSADFEKSAIVSPESIVSKNPQVLIVTGMAASADATITSLRKLDWMQATDAIKNNRVYRLSDASLVDRPGPRAIDGLEEVAGLLGTLK